MPQLTVSAGVEGDEVADHLIGCAADQGRRDVVSKCQDEDEQAAGADPGQRQRQIDPDKRDGGSRAERQGRAHIGRLDCLHHAVQRQHHERQQHVGHRNIDAEAVEDQPNRVVDDAQIQQRVVHDALVLQQHDPGRRPHQQRRPERQQTRIISRFAMFGGAVASR